MRRKIRYVYFFHIIYIKLKNKYFTLKGSQMMLGIVGKSNTGKSTFFKSATLIDVEISNRIFTTIKPNIGIGYITAKCPCKELNLTCNPQNSKCLNGIRFVPIRLIDIAGLVPDAHNGRGLGNQFLSDIMEANALIVVIDISGSTDDDGNPVPVGTHDPIKKDWSAAKSQQNSVDLFAKRLSGLGISKNDVKLAMEKLRLAERIENWSDDEALSFVSLLRKQSKPSIIAANKMDVAPPENLEKMKEAYPEKVILPASAEIELALREAAKHGLIEYTPGSSSFSVTGIVTEKQKSALATMEKFLGLHKSTNIQKVLDEVVFSSLGMVVVFPVESESKFSDRKGRVLPDCFLMKKDATALDLAYQVHEDIGKKFISAVNAKTKRSVSSDYKLQQGDIISIKSRR